MLDEASLNARSICVSSFVSQGIRVNLRRKMSPKRAGYVSTEFSSGELRVHSINRKSIRDTVFYQR